MRNISLTCRTIAIELCEIFIVRRDDHCIRSHVIRVIGAMDVPCKSATHASENKIKFTSFTMAVEEVMAA